MNKKAIDDMYELATNFGGYSKSKDEFLAGLKTNDKMFDDMYELAKTEANYSKSKEDFKTLMGISTPEPVINQDSVEFTQMAENVPYEIPSDVIAKQASEFIPGSETFKAKAIADEETRIRKAREEKNAKFQNIWNKADIYEKSQYLADQTELPVEDVYESIIRFPHKAENEAKSYFFKGTEPSSVASVYARAKDFTSTPGRLISAGLDQALSPTKASKENFVESVSRTTPSVPEGEEERSLFGEFSHSVVKDPFTLITAPIGTGAGKATGKAVGKAVAKLFPDAKVAGKIVKGAVAGGAGGASEELTRGVLESTLGDKEFNPSNVALAGLFGGVLGSAGGLLGNRAKLKFEEQIPNRAYERWTNDPKMRPAIDRTYEKAVGLFDYNLPKQVRKTESAIKNLGKKKEQSLKTAQSKMSPNTKFNMAIGRDDILSPEVVRVRQDIATGKMSPDEGTEYLKELANVENQYFKSYKKLGNVNEGRNSINTAINDINTALENNVFEKSNIVDLFNTRKAMDRDLKRAYDKIGKDKKLTMKEDAYLTGRTMLNKKIDNALTEIEKDLKRRAELPAASSNDKLDYDEFLKLKKDLEASKALPDLYKERDVLQSLGGGRAGKTSAQMFAGHGIKDFILPQSGIREKQLSSLFASPKAIPIIMKGLRNEEEQPLF